jgi:hypothetical protein
VRALEGGRDVLNWVCVRGIRPNVWCVLTGTIPMARRLRVGRAEGRYLAAWQYFFVCETGYDVSLAGPECTRMKEGIAWVKPDLVRTESLQ